MKGEAWKTVKDYEGLYEVSNFGRVKSKKRTTTQGGILNPSKGKCYLYITLCKNGIKKTKMVHKVVVDSFHGVNEGMEVNHRNGVKTDNELDNLEWITKSGNAVHSLKYGLRGLRPVKQIAKDGTLIRVWSSIISAARGLKIYDSSIVRCCKGKTETCGGFLWKYATPQRVKQPLI